MTISECDCEACRADGYCKRPGGCVAVAKTAEIAITGELIQPENLRRWALFVQIICAPGDEVGRVLENAALTIEKLRAENRALFDGYQGCIADRARLTEENAALRSGHWARGVRWRIVTGLLLIAFACGLAGAGAALLIRGCG